MRFSILLSTALLLGAACVPKAPPLGGVPAPAVLPRTDVPSVPRRIVFDWRLFDNEIEARGEGAARVVGPDSARLDFFVGGGLGGGHAVLIGDELRAPGAEMIRTLVPPPPLLWATLGRLAVPTAADTVVRVQGDTLWAEIGRDSVWRATFVDRELRSLQLIRSGRIEQRVTRGADGRVIYENPRGGRRLELAITRVDTVGAFDASIWR